MILNKQNFLQPLKKMAFLFRGFSYLPCWIILTIDLFISIFAFACAYLICYHLQSRAVLILPFLSKLGLNTLIVFFSFLIFAPYKGIVRYSNVTDGLKVFLATAFSTISMIVINYIYKLFYYQSILPLSGFMFYFMLFFFFMLSFRIIVRLVYSLSENTNLLTKKDIPILIFDVSPTIVSIAEMLKNNSSSPYRIVGFISPDNDVKNKSIHGIPVFSMTYKDVSKFNKKHPKALLINPLETGEKEKQAIVDYCEKHNLKILAAPPIAAWKNEKNAIEKIKDIQIEDLLGRIPITISVEEISKNLAGQCILVTGAAGSIGSEIVRQIAHFHPRLLLACDLAEPPLHNMQLEIKEKFTHLNFLPIVCDVKNYNRMKKIFETYQPNYLYHAAAYKHVPLMEGHPCEAVSTNVIGTKNMADLSVEYGVEAFVMISTDKAVNPTNVMGASKRIAEIYVQSLYKEVEKNQTGKTKFITTRFGNVLGSNGSVVPRFKEQIEKGGPVTVTHPEIIRYFMTIPEACRLVLEAAYMGKGGEIFVFDMGSPIKIVDLAKKMIRLVGSKPNDDIDIIFTGLRPGEKLYEELLANEETTKPTYNEKIMIAAVRDNYEYSEVKKQLTQLHESVFACQDDEVLKLMKDLVPEYVCV